MKQAAHLSILFLMLVYSLNCQSPSPGGAGKGENSAGISPNRKLVRKGPVASYREKTDNPLNDWYFSVGLYETPLTFQYLLKMQFEELKGEDTLLLPDLGSPPQPVIQKGKDKYSCVVGFLDKDTRFREYKLVYVKEGRELKLVTLHHYAMVPTR